MSKAPLIEVFHSVQGEGRFVGAAMTFVRVATCPLRCAYCDTPHSYTAGAHLTVRLGATERREANPVTAERAAELVAAAAAAAGESTPRRVSITGGEPLVVPAFVRDLGRALAGRGCAVHLETAAIDPAALEQCVAFVDHLSADYKLPETLLAAAPVGAPGPDGFAAEHVRCCELALARGATVDVKIVLTDAVTAASLQRALDRLQPLRSRVLLVLQPVTPCGVVTAPLPAAALADFVQQATRGGFDVRVLPQVHKLLGVP